MGGHYLRDRGSCDGVFASLRPGLILSWILGQFWLRNNWNQSSGIRGQWHSTMLCSPVTLGPCEKAPVSPPHCQFPFSPLNLLLLCLSRLLSETLAQSPRESSVQPPIVPLHSLTVNPAPYSFTTETPGVPAQPELRASHQAFRLFSVSAFFQGPRCQAQAALKHVSP